MVNGIDNVFYLELVQYKTVMQALFQLIFLLYIQYVTLWWSVCLLKCKRNRQPLQRSS